MSVESQVNNIADLNPTYPQADDPVSQGDNHIRNIKKALKDTFPNIDGTVTASEDELNQLVGQALPGDVVDLEARVGNNESDIANNAAAIANNAADIANNEAQLSNHASNIVNNSAAIANNASAISANTDYIKAVEVIAVNNGREIQDKADKSYVDSQDSAQDQVIAQKADKSYVDSGLSAKADKSYVDSKNNAQDAVIAQKADKSYVDSEIGAIPGGVTYSAGTNLNLSGNTFNVDTTLTGLTDVQTSNVSVGNFDIQLDGSTSLRIRYNGTDIFRIDNGGNLILKGDVTAFGSP